MRLSTMSTEELSGLEALVQAERARRERVRVELGFIDERVALLEGIADEVGVVPFAEVPAGGHLPGQVVEFEGALWRNVSGRQAVTAPGVLVPVWVQESESVPVPDDVLDDVVDAGEGADPDAGE